MKVLLSKQFLKDLKKLPKGFRSKVESLVFESLAKLVSIEDIRNIKKLSGHETAYRIRLGDYRLGLFYEDGCLLLSYIGARGDFYKKFP